GSPRHLDIKAAWLRLQPTVFVWDRQAGHPDSGTVSHTSACQLHELGDIPAPDVEITVPRRRTTNDPFVRLRTASLRPEEITIVDGLPATTVPRTITDLLQAKADGGHIGGVIADANRRDLISLDDLARQVQPHARRYGLKASASGRDLINHLVEQAGESLHRQEIARASEEGFTAALNLLAHNPRMVGLTSMGRPGMARALQQISRTLGESVVASRPDPAVLRALGEAMARSVVASRPDPAALRALGEALTQSPALRVALDGSADSVEHPERDASWQKDHPGDSSSDGQTSG
ncbi:hypothetical protein ACFU6O_31305, partial [Streptomyces albidoflavus]